MAIISAEDYFAASLHAEQEMIATGKAKQQQQQQVAEQEGEEGRGVLSKGLSRSLRVVSLAAA
jgi:hypothetical protein